MDAKNAPAMYLPFMKAHGRTAKGLKNKTSDWQESNGNNMNAANVTDTQMTDSQRAEAIQLIRGMRRDA